MGTVFGLWECGKVKLGVIFMENKMRFQGRKCFEAGWRMVVGWKWSNEDKKEGLGQKMKSTMAMLGVDAGKTRWVGNLRL